MRRGAARRDNVLRLAGAGSIGLPGKPFTKPLAERLLSNSFLESAE